LQRERERKTFERSGCTEKKLGRKEVDNIHSPKIIQVQVPELYIASHLRSSAEAKLTAVTHRRLK